MTIQQGSPYVHIWSCGHDNIYPVIIWLKYDHLDPGQWLWTSTTQPPWSALLKEALRWTASHDNDGDDIGAGDQDVYDDDEDNNDDDDDDDDDERDDNDDDDDLQFEIICSLASSGEERTMQFCQLEASFIRSTLSS